MAQRTKERTMLNIGVVGYGYWGPNIVRNFNAIEGVNVIGICDRSPEALKRAKKAHPHIETCKDYRHITRSARIDVVAVVTPVSTHYALAKDALDSGKHVFVEKPFTATVNEAERLITLAARKRRKLMVDHTFIFTGAVKKIKELIDAHELGKLYYYDSTRVNLGLFQHDVNVVWDLAPHDFSVMDHVIKAKPYAIVAHGADHFNRSLEDVAYITVYFRDNMIAHFNVNWLSPVKIRMTLIGGTKRMLVWNDLDMEEKIKVYNKGVDVKNEEGLYKLLVDYRSGDMWAPRVDYTEALKTELEYFVDCIKKNRTPVNDGQAGLRVVRMLEASDRSMRQNGKMIRI
jgi:predicted dehydrogenase